MPMVGADTYDYSNRGPCADRSVDVGRCSVFSWRDGECQLDSTTDFVLFRSISTILTQQTSRHTSQWDTNMDVPVKLFIVRARTARVCKMWEQVERCSAGKVFQAKLANSTGHESNDRSQLLLRFKTLFNRLGNLTGVISKSIYRKSLPGYTG